LQVAGLDLNGGSADYSGPITSKTSTNSVTGGVYVPPHLRGGGGNNNAADAESQGQGQGQGQGFDSRSGNPRQETRDPQQSRGGGGEYVQSVPALLDVLAKFYLAEQNLTKVVAIVLNYGLPELLADVGKQLSVGAWGRCFEQFVELQRGGRLVCANCECISGVEQEQLGRHFFYNWNCFLNIALDHMSAGDTLALIFKWSSYIPNDAIDREFYSRCLLKG